ncbi:bifunctional folylpolyglutamate synthase/dihydrofolate synthase [Bacillus sp. FJAT-42376]|uniref:bifunctional folylpolyglutamate synthase/dihydrofolate synthase n=1 Tax=Bacillus sp. FJAT-42376 TaxID=2014076 RepID=UPI000F4FD002|nr:folylpolyglutamate synthase/dihydrofolate synthase family protein [Bacillus sp. FJAT-42376]AZB43822.1 bifunctional folylpolyglutamate synthase/dihydrofolate synthase [Bacillus sp. FJAT-42376]
MLGTYEETLDWIHSRLRFGIKPGLGRMNGMMEKLGNPHTNIKTIHIAGTNGKGSTVSYLRSMLNEAGYKVGTFTSPYLETFNERISMNGNPISSTDLIALANVLKPVAEAVEAETGEAPTEFEIITAMAFYYFGVQNQPDFVLLETGLGGRLDSTNIAEPILSIITNTGYDHMNILGDTLEEIAAEKAGIIKWETPAVTAVEAGKGLSQIRSKASAMNAELYVYREDFKIDYLKPHSEGETFSLTAGADHWRDLQISMYGAHQTVNASLAVISLNLLKKRGTVQITDAAIRTGLHKASWSGRYEIISRSPLIVLDGAHNLEGAQSLSQTIRIHGAGKKVHMLFTALEDKDYSGMLHELEKAADSIYLTEFDFPRAASASVLYNVSRAENKQIAPDWKTFIRQFPEELGNGDMLVVCGSLYFISQIRQVLLETKRNF